MQQILDVERAQAVEQKKQADCHGGVAHTGHDEGLSRRAPVHRILVPEADEQITAQADAFPAEIQQQEVVRQQQRHHGGHEQVHVGEEAAVTFVVSHEFRGIEVDQEAHERDHQHHDQRKSVQIEGDLRAE